MVTATRNCTLRLYPTARQAAQLENWLELHRLLYNQCLAERRDAWREEERSVSYREQQNALLSLKTEKPWYLPLGSHALQETVRRVDRAFKAFFRRVREGGKPGFPRFKAYGRFDSFTYPCVAGWKLLELAEGKGRLKVSGLGHIKLRGKCRVDLMRLERKALRCCTVRRRAGKWYATITYHVEISDLARPFAPQGAAAGLGTLATLSDGAEVERVRHLDHDAARIRAAQRSLSRKKKGSANRRKAVQKLSRLQERVAARRKDHLEKASARIVSRYAFLAVEDLSVKNMSKKGGRRKSGLNRSMADAALELFLTLLASKAEEAGCELVKVNPRGTTQECCRCGRVVPKTLSDRIHACPCGLVMDRDRNAAINIFTGAWPLPGGNRPSCGETSDGSITFPLSR